MRVSANVTLRFKDLPKEYRGIISQNYALGKGGALPFDSMCRLFTECALEFYEHFETAENLTSARDAFVRWLERLEFHNLPAGDIGKAVPSEQDEAAKAAK